MNKKTFTQKEMVDFWFKSAKEDLKTAELLFKNKRYDYCLFFCHLAVEKSLKGIVYRVSRKQPPFIHDLVRLAYIGKLELNEEMYEAFNEITTFNVAARYDNIKKNFYKQATISYTKQFLKETKDILKWLQR